MKGRNSKLWLAMTVIWLCLSGITIAVERHVPSQYSTIQAAIDAAVDDDTVIVAPGTYTGDGNRDIDFKGKAITVRSIDPNDPSVVAATIIDCQGTEANPHRGFYFQNGESPDSVLSGLTITNGMAPIEVVGDTSMHLGGAIFCNGSSPMINNCIIRNNFSYEWNGFGGGIACSESNMIIAHCIIMNNRTNSHGGGVYCINSSPKIKCCVIIGNVIEAYGNGGGVCCYGGVVTITNSIVAKNIVESYGGGVYSGYGGSSMIDHSTIVGNRAGRGGALGEGYSTVRNTIIWDNRASYDVAHRPTNLTISFSDVQGDFPGEGNINADPLFVNPAGGDYHLSAYTPCYNAGDPNHIDVPGETDIDGEPRVFKGRVDMGADEFFSSRPVIVISPVEAALNIDKNNPNPETKILYIRNIGLDILRWEIVKDCNWLEAVPTRGESTGEINDVNLYLDISGLAPGTYTCELAVVSDGALNSPQIALLTVRVYEGNGDNRLDIPSEFGTVQDAIDFALNGDVIVVSEGIYTSEGNTNIDFKGKAITVQGTNPHDSNVVAATVINCQGSSRGFYFHSREKADSVLMGLTVANGRALDGGGIYCKNSNPTIKYCIITRNRAEDINPDGGGIYLENSNSEISHCMIINNSTIGSNRWGGGIFCYGGKPTITNCTISGNSALKGGGIFSWSEGLMVENCILWGDNGSYGSPEINYYTSSYRPHIYYSDVQGGWPGEGNIDADPMFVAPDSDDFHLLPDSPCINAGDPDYVAGPNETDIDGELRVMLGRIDMGADEFNPFEIEFIVVNKRRIGRTIFEYDCNASLHNISRFDVKNIQLEIVKTPENMKIIDPNVTFGNIVVMAGESAMSTDTCTFEVDRAKAIEPMEIIWWSSCELVAAGQTIQHSGSSIVFLEQDNITGDLTGEGKVDFADLAKLAEQWLGPAGIPSADIAPPGGDGTVNFLDFAELAENWRKW